MGVNRALNVGLENTSPAVYAPRIGALGAYIIAKEEKENLSHPLAAGLPCRKRVSDLRPHGFASPSALGGFAVSFGEMSLLQLRYTSIYTTCAALETSNAMRDRRFHTGCARRADVRC